jgi:sugar phosphate isomerase/epimerase
MRFGGFLPGLGPAAHYGFSDWYMGLDFQIAWAKRLGWRCFQPTGFQTWDVAQQRATVQLMALHDLVTPGIGAYQFNMLHPDPRVRHEHVRAICALVERAATIGVPTIETVAGSRNPEVSYAAAPGNSDHDAWQDFVRSAREVCDACRGTSVSFVLEPVIGTLLDSPSALHRGLVEIDRPTELGFNFDLVNFATPELADDLRPVVDEVVEHDASAIRLIHIKDVRYEPRQRSLHVWEVPPGEGRIDFDYWLAKLKPLALDVPAFIEHLTDMGQMISAWHHVRAAAVRVGEL